MPVGLTSSRVSLSPNTFGVTPDALPPLTGRAVQRVNRSVYAPDGDALAGDRRRGLHPATGFERLLRAEEVLGTGVPGRVADSRHVVPELRPGPGRAGLRNDRPDNVPQSSGDAATDGGRAERGQVSAPSRGALARRLAAVRARPVSQQARGRSSRREGTISHGSAAARAFPSIALPCGQRYLNEVGL